MESLREKFERWEIWEMWMTRFGLDPFSEWAFLNPTKLTARSTARSGQIIFRSAQTVD